MGRNGRRRGSAEECIARGTRRVEHSNVPVSVVKLTEEQLETLGKRYRLSPRERQILDLLFEGLPTNRLIAERLETTEDAVKAGVRTLFLKTRTQSKHEMVLVCLDSLHPAQDDAMRRAEMDNAKGLLAYARELERRISRLERRKD